MTINNELVKYLLVRLQHGGSSLLPQNPKQFHASSLLYNLRPSDPFIARL